MPSYNVTLDDVSPLWTYSGQWTASDADVDLYANSTFHATNQTGASVRIAFNGTAVYLYGGQQDFNGSYTVTVDGQSYSQDGPSASAGDTTPLLLFSQDGLPRGAHVVQLTDTSTDPSRRLEFDRGVVTLGDGDPTTKSTDVLMDDMASNLTYTGAWETSTIDWSKYFWGQTMHRWGSGSLSATVGFYGNAITLFGAMNDQHRSYTIALDGGAPQTYSGRSLQYNAQQILYAVSDLELADHSISVKLVESAPFSIDYVVASAWESKVKDGGSTSGSSTSSGVPPAQTSSTSTSNGGGTPVGAIAGGVIGGVLVLIALALLAFFLRRRHRHNARALRVEKGGQGLIPFEGTAGAAGHYAGSGGPHSRYQPIATGHSPPAPRSDGMGSAPDGEDGPTYAGTALDMAPPGYDQVLRAREPSLGVSTPVAPVSPAAQAMPFSKGSGQRSFAGGARPLPTAPR